tara:strand:+ start:7064 stop:7501 length:438 start_codon:yes stop_codon:yes gene_type:complete
MIDKIILIIFAIGIFIYICKEQFMFQKGIYQSIVEDYQNMQYKKLIKNETDIMKNGYSYEEIKNIPPSFPEPNNPNELGNFPKVEQEIKTDYQNLNYLNNYKFKVDLPCRKTSTGMFTDCGVYAANSAWTADPYKGLNCPLQDKE